jgi:peptidoglycan/LPS O-acetylase OafA/YrhL
MGMFRILLAIAVVIVHAGNVRGYNMLRPSEAVEAFFIISGFYMALILNEKYTGPGSYRLFITNRLLRIYPTYWFVLCVTVVAWAVSIAVSSDPGPFAIHRHHLGLPAMLLIYLSNLFIIGQDWVMFVGVDPHGHLYWARTFMTTDPQLWKFLFIPPAWSLDVELTFYVMAPWLVRRAAKVIAAMIAASIALRLFLYAAFHLAIDPWGYRFFPTELAFFLAGALAYKAYRVLNTKRPPKALQWTVTGSLLLIVILFQFIPLRYEIKHVAFFALAWIALPFMFLATKRSSMDRYIGELSYPVYVCHWPVLMFLPRLFTLAGATYSPIWTIVGSIIFAIFLAHAVVKPIERLRERRVRNARTQAAGETLGQVVAPAITP